MIIGVDAGALSIEDKRLKVGVYRVNIALLRALSKLDSKNTYKLYSFLPLEKSLLKELGNNFENVVVTPKKGWFSIWLPIELKKHPVDIFLGFSQSLPRLSSKTKSLMFIYDLTFEQNSKWFPKSYKKLSANSRRGVKAADQLITMSKDTKREIVSLYSTNPAKITVIPAGFADLFPKSVNKKANLTIKKYGVRKPFLLFVGTLKPSKNIPNIIKAFSLFTKNYQSYQLILAGSDYWLDPDIEKTIKESNMSDKIKLLGFVSDTELTALYSQAEIFVSPSYNEGFGLTHLEAAFFGLPVIASKSGATKEVLQKGALYVDPWNPSGITLGIEKLIENKKQREEVIKNASQRIQLYSWEKSAQKLLNIIRNI